MKLLFPITWHDIFLEWKNTEKGVWDAVFTAQGFKNWEDWRQQYIQAIQPQNLSWNMFSFEAEESKDFLCGDFKQWLKISQEMGSRKFEILAQASVFQNSLKIEGIKQNFPSDHFFFGFQKGSDIMLFEGHHRCIALQQLLAQGKKFPKMHIALAERTQSLELRIQNSSSEQVSYKAPACNGS